MIQTVLFKWLIIKTMNISNKKFTIKISNRTLITAMLLVVLVFTLVKLKDLVLVVLTSIVIASFVRTASEKFKKYHMPKTVSVVGMYILGFALLSGIFYFFVPVLIVELSKLIPIVSKFIPGVLDTTTVEGAKTVANSLTEGAVLPDILKQLQGVLVSVSSGFLGVISNLFGNIANVILIIVISFYLSLADDGIESFLKIVTPQQYEEYAISLWKRSQRKIAHWLRGQMVMGLIVGLLTFIGLALVGVEYALLLAVIAAVFEMIPFGIILASIPAISLAFASGGLTLAILVAGLYVVIQQVESYIVQPLVIRKVTGISPIAVILSVLVGFKLAGFWGLILAIPVAVTLLEYIKDREKNKIETREYEKE